MVRAVGSNHQKQRMVTTLKGICRLYPGDHTILRELLQNADDAGATEVRFVVDDREHPTDNLIDPHLARYQGPALLAFNNAEFADKDFENLKNTGDSYKFEEAATTGRFGLGFNSVYNWTDSPSIVSRDQILFLEPHERWADPHAGHSPKYNFVDDAADPAMQGQMAVFRSIMPDATEALPGTIIRIPLRTPEQEETQKSEITGHIPTLQQVRKVLNGIAVEFGTHGFLFLRNLERLVIESTLGEQSEIRLTNLDMVRDARSKIKTALECASTESSKVFAHSLMMEIEYISRSGTKTQKLAIQHHIGGNINDKKLSKWATKEKIVSWVAVAAPLPPPEDFKGKFFTVLSLPLSSAQPVHIHGMFSLSPDRARLLVDSNKDSLTPAAEWNKYLFAGPIPEAWAGLLDFIAKQEDNQKTLPWWPRIIDDDRDHLNKTIDLVIEIIKRDGLAVFPTEIGNLNSQNAILENGTESGVLKKALKEARIPVVYMSKNLRVKIQLMFTKRTLSPALLCKSLQNENLRIRTWTDPTKQKILEYLLTKFDTLDGYDGLELFPFEDGTYKSIAGRSAFVLRNDAERSLFHHEKLNNLDLNRASEATRRILHNLSKGNRHPMIKYRSVKNFRDYLMNNIFHGQSAIQDVVTLIDDGFVPKAWNWISQNVNSLTSEDIADLWLIPLTNGTYRKIKPKSPLKAMLVHNSCPLSELLRRLDSEACSKSVFLICSEKLGLKSSELKKIFGTIDNQKLYLQDSRSQVHLTQWLNDNSALVSVSSDDDKGAILAHLAVALSVPVKDSDLELIRLALRPLTIMKKVSWIEDGVTTAWTSLDAADVSIGLLEGLIPIPEIKGHQFLITEPASNTKRLLDILEMVQGRDTTDLIQSLIIPNFANSQSTIKVKEQAAKFLLGRFSSLEKKSQQELRVVPMVPATTVAKKGCDKLFKPIDLIDPSEDTLKSIFFDTDPVLPESGFFQEFGTQLKLCGLKTEVDAALAQQRVEAFASSDQPLSEIEQHAHNLLKLPCRWGQKSTAKDYLYLRTLEWLPILVNEVLTRKAPKDIRGFKDRLLVGFQMPILRLEISEDWSEKLGWNEKIPPDVLFQQLIEGLTHQSRDVVDAVLSYLNVKSKLVNQLEHMPVVLTSNGTFALPSDTFQSGCGYLMPYLGNVDMRFWDQHKLLLQKLGVRSKPQEGDLLKVQQKLEENVPLGESDIKVAIRLLTMATGLETNDRNSWKMIDTDGNFCAMTEVIYSDLEHVAADRRVTHPRITRQVAQAFGVEFLSQRQLKSLLEIMDDDDDDEFDQKEQVTTRISDNLDRYSVVATFREYLANADDAKATEISWLLDERQHGSESLLTPELKSYQGPALLAHNNSVFNDADLEGFKNVGEGSKRRDTSSIGQFGRGSQTMFHWTDVPMILSGEWLLILDPQQRVLLNNQRRGQRKPGVKISLKKIRSGCPGQLEPFEGLWNYLGSVDYYNGTIFRFPLRKNDSNSRLRSMGSYLDCRNAQQLLDSYFDEARISLLFLKHVRKIEFAVHGQAKVGWIVERSVDEDLRSTSRRLLCSFVQSSTIRGTDHWRVAKHGAEPANSKDLPQNPPRLIKDVECGMAALISSKPGNNTTADQLPTISPPCMFSTLPLPLPSNLPVYVHATFSLSGDRRSLVIGEHGGEKHAPWNKYYLEEALPKLYLEFLEDIGMNNPKVGFAFWPHTAPPPESCSHELFNVFWKILSTSTRKLFLKAHDHNHQLLTLQEAVFIPHLATYNEKIIRLLLSLDVKLVQEMPFVLAKQLSKTEGANHLTEAMLRKTFSSTKSRGLLQQAISDDSTILHELMNHALETKDNPYHLDGCHLLLFADGKLGPLRIRQKESPESDCFVATAEEIDIFDFAKSVLISQGNWKPIARASKDKYFAVEDFDIKKIGHLQKLFRLRSLNSSFNRAWLMKFWLHWRLKANPNLIPTGLPVYLAVCNGQDICMKISELAIRPAVVKPITPSHVKLCTKFPGLYIFEKSFMTYAQQTAEDSFSYAASFFRFVKALQKLRPSNESIGDFVHSRLDASDRDVFRGLVMLHSPQKTGNAPRILDSPGFNEVKQVLQSIPLWPSFDPQHRLLSAVEASIIGGVEGVNVDALLAPWMLNRAQFVDKAQYHVCLAELGAKVVAPVDLLSSHIFPLPNMSLDNASWVHYKKLLPVINQLCNNDRAGNVKTFLQGQLVAVSQSRVSCDATLLLDHTDPLIVAAFGTAQNNRFLHRELQQLPELRPLWMKLNLRHNPQQSLNPGIYIECLGSLEARLVVDNLRRDAQLQADSQMVLTPLITPSSTWQTFQDPNWRLIACRNVFRSQLDMSSEPQYRRNPMGTVANGTPLLSLGEIISHSFADICWSQTPFPLHHPTVEVLSKFTSGKPSVPMVWRHLLHLKEQTQYLQTLQVPDFLHDLQETYQYLQQNIGDVGLTLEGAKDAVWLNLPSFEGNRVVLRDVRSEWVAIDDLVLSSAFDSGSIKAVRAGLMRFENLLRAMGCHSLSVPTVAEPERGIANTLSEDMMRLRMNEKYTDISFKTEGKIIKAHKVVIAAVSEAWEVLFARPHSDPINYEQYKADGSEEDVYLPYQTLQCLINYAYDRKASWSEMRIAEGDDTEAKDDKLDMLMYLFEGANLWIIPALKTEVETTILRSAALFITLANVKEMQKRAHDIDAHLVEAYCTEFINRNPNLVDRAHEGSEGIENAQEALV